MKFSLLVSILIHLGILGFVFWKSPQQIHRPVVSQVQLLSIQKKQQARKQRIKGSKKNQATKSDLRKRENLLSHSIDKKKGSDTEDVKAIVASKGETAISEVISYGQELQSYLEKNRFYPRRAQMMEQTGVVKVQFKINPNGTFAHVKILQATPYAILNKAARDLITNLKSFKPLPKSYKGNGEFVVPINYQLKSRGQ